LFCKIVAGEIPATKVYEDDDTLAFADLNPQAPVHVLVVPKRHFADIVDLSRDAAAGGALLNGIRATAESSGLREFERCSTRATRPGRPCFHVHAHVLGGRRMQWPPG